MEPDFDRILSKKIRQAEQRPVSWNKQVVWQNVRMETGTGRRYHFFYYVAAAMISLLIYFGVESIPNKMESQVTDARIKSNPTLDESSNPIVLEKKQDHKPDPTVRIPDNTAMVPVTKIPDSSRDTTQPAQSDIQFIDATAEPVADIQIPVEDLLLAEEVTVPEQKIRPVVGIITESHSEPAANVKRKKRLRKLEPSDQTPWENPGNALVFAMRK